MSVRSSLTHISLASLPWDLLANSVDPDQNSERGVWSGSALFANKNFYQK